MIRHFSAAELARMQGTQTSAMQDTCLIYAYSVIGTDVYGLPIKDHVPGDPVPCGYDPVAKEVQLPGAVGMIDAKLRLPIGTVVTEHDRIAITHRYGVGVQPLMHTVFGPPERGPSGLVVNLKLYTEEPTP